MEDDEHDSRCRFGEIIKSELPVAMKSDPVSRAAFNRFPIVWPFFYFLTSTFVCVCLVCYTHKHTAGSGRQIFPSNLGVCS